MLAIEATEVNDAETFVTCDDRALNVVDIVETFREIRPTSERTEAALPTITDNATPIPLMTPSRVDAVTVGDNPVAYVIDTAASLEAADVTLADTAAAAALAAAAADAAALAIEATEVREALTLVTCVLKALRVVDNVLKAEVGSSISLNWSCIVVVEIAVPTGRTTPVVGLVGVSNPAVTSR